MGRVVGIWRGPGGGIRTGPPQRDDRFVPVVALICERGMFDQPYLTPACRTQDHAEDVCRGIYLACRYFCSCGARNCTRKYRNVPTEKNPAGGCPDGGERVGCRADVVRGHDGKLHVQVTFYRKREAMREVARKYGSDPSKWPYQAKARKLRA